MARAFVLLNEDGIQAGNDQLAAIFETGWEAWDYIHYLEDEIGLNCDNFEIVEIEIMLVEKNGKQRSLDIF
jgi:hypothetical protein